MNDLDTMLRDALTTDADRAPELPTEWVGPTTATIVPIESRRRSRRAMVAVAGVAAAATLIAGLALLARPDAEPAPAATTPPPPAWQPPGEEFALTDLGPARTTPGGPVVQALTRRVGIPGHPARIVATSFTYNGGTAAEVQQCVWLGEDGGGSCRPEWYPLTWGYQDDGDVDGGLFTLDGLPAAVEFVGYSDGDTEFWQRPVFGFAAFPNLPGTTESVTAWDGGGTPIGNYGPEALLDGPEQVELPPMAITSQVQQQEVFSLTWTSMESCLTSRGGKLTDGDVATFADDVDQIAIWDECVAEVKAIVAEQVAALT